MAYEDITLQCRKFVLALTTPPDMIARIQKFFEQFIEPGTRQSDTGGEHTLQIASAALLYIGQADYIAAKQRARISTGLAGITGKFHGALSFL